MAGTTSGITDLEQRFEADGLPLPPIPEQFVEQLEVLAPWCWSTRPIDPFAMYMFARPIEEAERQEVADHLAISHAGHGVNSWGLNLNVVMGPLALFVQDGYGGVYMEHDECIRAIADTYQRVAEVLEVVEAAAWEGSYPRIFCAWSEFRWSCRSAVQPQEGATLHWKEHRAKAELFDAVAELAALLPEDAGTEPAEPEAERR